VVEQPMELPPGFEQFQDVFKHFQVQDPAAEVWNSLYI
jgi:hypothetical protein